MNTLFPFLLLAAISSSGFFLYTQKKVSRRVLNLFIGLGAGSMLSLSLVHIFPEAFEETSFAVYAFLWGFLMIYLIEEFLTSHHHDHSHGDHSHEDPHEHYDHVAMVSFIGIFIHTLFDGVSIRAGFEISDQVWYASIFAIALHQIPVSLSLAAIFRESKLSKRIQFMFLSLFALAASIWFLLSHSLFAILPESFTALAAAFSGWLLLYIATTDLMPVIHWQNQKKYLSTLFFLIGAVWMTCVRFFE